ncbi:MAG: rhomboid family intramembrane serine protease [Limisphaerales bacterium]|jgi:membrane associated rhomboid family serine protease
MLLPLSDAPNPRGVPVVTYLLIAANVLVYFLVTLPLGVRAPDLDDPALREYLEVMLQFVPPGMDWRTVLGGISAYDVYVFEHGFRPAAPEWTDLLTSIFLHGGFMHLAGNMLFLWIYGDNVEHRMGWWWYLGAYLATGVAATLFYSLFVGGSPLPLVGASGAISGLLGFYFLWFPRNTVRLFVFLFPIFMNVVEIPARLVLGVYLIIDNLLPFLVSQGGGGGVAHGAHLGGFLAGLAMAWYWDRRELERGGEEYRTEAGAEDAEGAVGDSLGAALEEGDFSRAARLYFAIAPVDTRGVLGAGNGLALADWLGGHGHPQAALTVYRRHLRDYPRGPGLAEAHLGAGMIHLRELGQLPAARQHFLEALESGPDDAVERRAREGLARVKALQKFGGA